MRYEVEDFVRERFAEYYKHNLDEVIPPRDLERREFGFILFRGNAMIRHKNFAESVELKRFITELVPSDAYHSAAYYEKPDENMNGKGWNGADLVFDIDADHLNIPCRLEHDRWTCMECGESDRGGAPESCPKCKGKIREESWICENCLAAAKREAIKLVGLLGDDFGLSHDKVRVNFTGHRGYHVHVFDEDVVKLEREERKEIVDYMTGIGVEYSILRSYMREDVSNASNWVKRILRRLNSKIIRSRRKRNFEESAERIIDEMSIKIDTVVTTDLHRLIRLVGTLNGKTGMKVVNVPVNMLDTFDPFKDAVALRGDPVKVYVKGAPSFRLGDEEFGPYIDVEEKLPVEAAILLICKGRASPVI